MSEFIKPEATITLTGRVVMQPEAKRVGTTRLLELRIPNDTRKKNKESGEYETVATTWFSAKFWGEKADEVGELSINKGDTVKVTGRLEQSVWKDKAGAERQSFEIAWPEVEVLQKGKSRSEDEDL